MLCFACSMSAIPLGNRVFHSRTAYVRSASVPVYDTYRPEKYKTWNIDTLKRACEAVHNGSSIRRTAEEYNIPRSTLHDYVTGRITFGAKSGAKAYLTEFISWLLAHNKTSS